MTSCQAVGLLLQGNRRASWRRPTGFRSRHAFHRRMMGRMADVTTILTAIQAGDLTRAAELMRDHLAASLRARPGFVNRGAPPMLGGLRRAR